MSMGPLDCTCFCCLDHGTPARRCESSGFVCCADDAFDNDIRGANYTLSSTFYNLLANQARGDVSFWTCTRNSSSANASCAVVDSGSVIGMSCCVPAFIMVGEPCSMVLFGGVARACVCVCAGTSRR